MQIYVLRESFYNNITFAVRWMYSYGVTVFETRTLTYDLYEINSILVSKGVGFPSKAVFLPSQMDLPARVHPDVT